MSKLEEESRRLLTTRQVLFSCEGKAEKVIVTKLVEENRIIVPDANVVRDMNGCPCTLCRKPADIQRDFLDTDYPDGLLIARIVDANAGTLTFKRPYSLLDIRILNYITSPEIERLVLIKEGALGAFTGRRGADRQLNASDWCVQKLGLADIKKESFLRGYWNDVDVLVDCINKSDATVGGRKKDQLALKDLLK